MLITNLTNPSDTSKKSLVVKSLQNVSFFHDKKVVDSFILARGARTWGLGGWSMVISQLSIVNRHWGLGLGDWEDGVEKRWGVSGC